MGCNKTVTCNFKIPKKCCVINIGGNGGSDTSLGDIPIPISLGPGAIIVNGDKYPEEEDPSEDLKENVSKTFVWKQSIYSNVKSMDLVFSLDEKSGLKMPGDNIAPINIRAVQDPPGANDPVGTGGGSSLAPGALLGEGTFSTEGAHTLSLNLPTSDVIVYVAFKYPYAIPIGNDRTEIHGLRIDLMF